jgi:hypothetical protein
MTNWKVFGGNSRNGLIDVLARQVYGVNCSKPRKPFQSCSYIGQDSNWAPPRHQSRMMPLHQNAWQYSCFKRKWKLMKSETVVYLVILSWGTSLHQPVYEDFSLRRIQRPHCLLQYFSHCANWVCRILKSPPPATCHSTNSSSLTSTSL